MGTSNRETATTNAAKEYHRENAVIPPMATFFSILFRLPSTQVSSLCVATCCSQRLRFDSLHHPISSPPPPLQPTTIPLCLPHLLPFFVPRVVIDFRQATAALTLTYLLPLATTPYHSLSPFLSCLLLAHTAPTPLCVSSRFATSFAPLFCALSRQGDGGGTNGSGSSTTKGRWIIGCISGQVYQVHFANAFLASQRRILLKAFKGQLHFSHIFDGFFSYHFT